MISKILPFLLLLTPIAVFVALAKWRYGRSVLESLSQGRGFWMLVLGLVLVAAFLIGLSFVDGVPPGEYERQDRPVPDEAER